MGALNTDIFSQQKSLLDQQQLQQAFQLAKATQLQALQTGGIDAASKTNIYKTQVLSAAAGTGDQNAYNTALGHLAQSGIDVSDVPQDITLGAKYAEAGRLAQSPLGSLLGAAQKQQSNDIALSGITGIITPGALKPTLPGSITPQILTRPAVTSAPLTQPVDQGSIPVPAKPLVADSTGAIPIDSPQPSISISPTPTAKTAVFEQPQRMSNETNAAYNARVSQAFDQYKANPDYMGNLKQNEAAGTKTGDAIGEAAKTLNIMQSNLPAVLKRFETMRSASDNADYGIGSNNEGTGLMQELYKNFKGSDTAKANAVLQQAAAQGILPELGPQLAQAGVKGNKFLETIANNASGLDLAAPPDAKKLIINGLENTYISNLKSTAAQLRADGKEAPSDAEIDAAVKQYKSAPSKSAPNLDQAFAAKKSGLPMVSTQAQFDALPSGSTYISTNGQPHTKP